MVLSNPIGQKYPCVLQDIVPFGAAALLTITYNHQHTKQGNGYRWPHIALGRLVCVCVCVGRGVGRGVGCGWGLAAPAHPSATILWPRVTCYFNAGNSNQQLMNNKHVLQPAGLALHNLTEPDMETMSPVEKTFAKFLYHISLDL